MTWEELESTVASCTLCSLHEGRIKPVFAKGNNKSKIMICGMVPAIEENESGIPFVGKAGRLLDEILLDSGLTLDNVYVTNLVKCFLAAGKPLQLEWIQACFPYLLVQIYKMKPKVIISLGKDSSFALLGKKTGSLSSVIGKLHDLDSINILPTYHPSYLLRTGGKNTENYNKVLDHFKLAKSLV